MATITALSTLTKVQTILQDTTGIRWPIDVELLGWLNDGQREVVLHKPEASVKNESLALTSGSTKQAVPATGIMLLDITRNMGAAGTTPGKAIRLVTRDVLDSQRPDWHADANAAGYIQHFMYDPRDPKNFYVYPKAPATAHYVEVVYSAAPVDCATTAATIGIDDIFANALVDYVLYRAYSKDAEYAQNGQLAVAHYTAFANALGLKTQNEQSRNPNTTISNLAYNPTIPSGATGASTGK